jgi:hypothetical protein
MPLAEANHSFIPVIHSDAIRMPLAEANHLFIPIIHSDAIGRS